MMIIQRRHLHLFGLIVLAASQTSIAADSSSDLTDLSLEQLMEISVASRKPLSEQDSPGIVTIITGEEILNSGARDLTDVMRLVPGFQEAADYNGTIGFGIRGLWGLEGKVLFMLDGVPLNDLYYNSAFLGDRLPLQDINRIEIIRGPGSAIYGNQAEYAVINILTETGSKLNGSRATVTYGRFSKETSRNNIALSFGKKYGDDPRDLDFSLKFYLSGAEKTDQDVTYPSGETLSAYSAYKTLPQHLNAAIKYRGITSRLILDHTTQRAQDYDRTALSQATNFKFHNTVASLKYDWSISPRMTISPEYSFTDTISYYNTDPNPLTIGGGTAPITNSDLYVTRHRINIPVSMDIGESLNLVVGTDFYRDAGGAGTLSGYYDKNNYNPVTQTNAISSKSIVFSNWSLFAQSIYENAIATITLGGRFETHSHFGASFVPRIGLTKKLDKWHFKLLYNQAFRYPSIGNANDAASRGNSLEPERTRALEAEIGYGFTKALALNLNFFDTLVTKPIIYLPSTQTYTNLDQTGSRGIEATFKANGSWGFGALTYSFYTTAGIPQVEKFIVSGDSTQLAAFAPHKLTFNTSIRATSSFQINPQIIWLSNRYTYGTPADASDNLQTYPVASTWLVNLYASYSDFVFPKLTLGLGVFDLLGSNYIFATAYDLGRNSVPGPSREYIARLSYKIEI